MHDMTPIVALETPAHAIDRMASAEDDYLQPTLPNESLIIMRNLGTTSQDLQTYPLWLLLVVKPHFDRDSKIHP